MATRVSRSILDPYLTVPLKSIYNRLPIPSKFPPEGVVFIGHFLAVLGAFALAYLTTFWWMGLVAAFCVAAALLSLHLAVTTRSGSMSTII